MLINIESNMLVDITRVNERKWFEPRSSSRMINVIVWVGVALRDEP